MKLIVTRVTSLHAKNKARNASGLCWNYNEHYRFNIGAALCSATIFRALSASALA